MDERNEGLGGMILGGCLDELLQADEATIRFHREEIFRIAESLHITDIWYAGGNKLVATPHDDSPPVPLYEFSARVTALLGMLVQTYSPVVAERAKTSLGMNNVFSPL